MRIGVPREVRDGERRVALVPEVVAALVEDGTRGAASRPARETRRASPTTRTATRARWWSTPRACTPTPSCCSTVQRPTAEQLTVMRPGVALAGAAEPAGVPGGHAGDRRARRHRLRARPGAAHHARPGHGRAVVAGHGVRLQGGAAGRRGPAPLLPDADDRRRHGAAREGARARRRRGRAAGHRHGAPARRRRVRPSTPAPWCASRSRASARASWRSTSRTAEGEGGYATELSRGGAPPGAGARRARRRPSPTSSSRRPWCPAAARPCWSRPTRVAAMRAGSVIVDLAAEAGGNCELTSPGHEMHAHGVTMLGPVNLPSTMAWDASALYARNVARLRAAPRPRGRAARSTTRTRSPAAR